MPVHLKLEAPWDEVKERLKEVNLSLTDQDLEYSPGNEPALLEKLSQKLHMSTTEVKALIESVSSNDGKAS